jgi:hypothetical protein
MRRTAFILFLTALVSALAVAAALVWPELQS